MITLCNPSRVISVAAAANSSSGTQQTRPRRLPVLILPGFLSNSTLVPSQYQELRNSLLARNHCAVDILPVSTFDWLPTLSGGSFLFYVERLAAAVRQLHADHGSKVCLVGVSAGGWLARLALGSVPYDGQVFGLTHVVDTLICLGTPHTSQERYPFGRAEEPWIFQHGLPDNITTSLQYCNFLYPDAKALKPTRIVCVVGSAVCGRAVEARDVRQVFTGRVPPSALKEAWFIQSSYVANCGDPAVDGDGVTPIASAMLPGAESLVLPGVWHNATPGKRWYGSPEVVAEWDRFLP